MDVAARSIEAMKKIAQLRQQLEEESDEEEEVRRGGEREEKGVRRERREGSKERERDRQGGRERAGQQKEKALCDRTNMVVQLLWLSGRALAAQTRGVLGSTPSDSQPFHCPLFSPHNFL